MRRPTNLNVSFVAVCILLGLAGMFLTFFHHNSGFTVKETRSRGVVSANPEGTDAPASGGPRVEITEQQAGDVTELMRTLQNAPNDADALRRIGEIFIAAQEWGRAEFFLGRAVLSRPGDIRPRYLLGISQYRQNKIATAAKTFEDLLQIKEDSAAMYNLAVIYKYHSGKKAEAESLLRKIIASPESDADTVGRARTEL